MKCIRLILLLTNFVVIRTNSDTNSSHDLGEENNSADTTIAEPTTETTLAEPITTTRLTAPEPTAPELTTTSVELGALSTVEPTWAWNTSLIPLTMTITKMKESIFRIENTIAQIQENALQLEEERINNLYHDCALLIISGNFAEALDIYNKFTDKKSLIQKVVETIIDMKTSEIYEVIIFIFKTHSDYISVALIKLYNHLMSVGQLHILNTLIFHEMVSNFDLNVTVHIKDMLHDRLVSLCRNNEFMELYEYANDTRNVHILNQVIPTFVAVTYDNKFENLPNILNIYSNFSHIEFQLQIISESLKQIDENKLHDLNSNFMVMIPHIQKLQDKIITSSKNEKHKSLLKNLIRKMPNNISRLLGPINCIKNEKTDEFLFVGLQRFTKGKKQVIQKTFSTSAIYPAGTKKMLAWSLFNVIFSDTGNSIYINNAYFNEFIYINADGLIDSTKLALGQENAQWYLEKADEEYFYLKNVKFNTFLHSLDSVGKRLRQVTAIEDNKAADKWRIGSCQSMTTSIVSG